MRMCVESEHVNSDQSVMGDDVDASCVWQIISLAGTVASILLVC